MGTAATVLQVAVAQNQFRRVARFNHDQGVAGRTRHEHLVGMDGTKTGNGQCRCRFNQLRAREFDDRSG